MAASHSSEAKPRTVRIAEPPTPMRLATWGLLVPMLRDIFRQLGVKIEIQGAKRAAASPDGGASFELEPGVAAEDHPWKLKPSGTGESTKIVVVAASVNSTGMPTIGGDPLDDDPPPELTGHGKVYATTKWDCSLTDDSTFVYAATLRKNEITIGVAAAIPADAGAGTDLQTKHFHIGTVSSAGQVTAQVLNQSLTLEACDDRGGNGEIELSYKLAS